MNAVEREKVGALLALKLPSFAWGMQIVKNLSWRLENNPAAPLTPKEKHLLDLCCWHYRNKLGGLVAFALPQQEPILAHYVPASPMLHPQERLL
ncbi:MAG TPA: hypothetical protein PKY50_06020 [Candidatus Competibacter sp.]|nr:hypothetical protein [Candidatus Competibacter sp.]